MWLVEDLRTMAAGGGVVTGSTQHCDLGLEMQLTICEEPHERRTASPRGDLPK